MTGFGAADGEVGGQRVSVEIRSVNHRYFSPSIKLPAALARWEAEVRDALRRGVSRGHVTLSARFGRDEVEAPYLAHRRDEVCGVRRATSSAAGALLASGFARRCDHSPDA